MIDSQFVYRWQNKCVVGWTRQTLFWLGELQVGGVPQNLNLEARKFWQGFVSPNHPQKLFQTCNWES